MYQFSYAEVAEESPQEMRGMERRVLDQAIERANLDWPPDLEVIVPLAPPLAP